MRNPVFTPEERKVMEALTDAHNAFCELPTTHVSHPNEWMHSMHVLQHIKRHKALQRLYPHEIPKSGGNCGNG